MSSLIVKLGDVPLACPSFIYGNTAGALSEEFDFVVTNGNLPDLCGLSGPLALKVECPMWNDGTRFKARFSHVYLWHIGPFIGDYHCRISVRDWRHKWEWYRVTADFNMPRRTNIQKAPGYEKGARADFERIAQFRYLPATLRDPSSGITEPTFAKASATNGQAWTAYQIVFWLIHTYLKNEHPEAKPYIEVDGSVSDNKVIPEEKTFKGDPFPTVLETFLDLARLNITMRGKTAVIYSTAHDIIVEGTGGYDGAGKLSISDTQRSRPQGGRHLVPQLWELRTDYVEKKAGATREAHALFLENVFQHPSDAGEQKAGTWDTIENGLREFKKDAKHQWALPFTTLDHCRQYFPTRDGEARVCRNLKRIGDNYVDPVLVKRYKTLKTCFRRYFRICPVWLDSIQDWWTLRAELVDPRTKYQARSPVFADHTIVPSVVDYGKNKQAVRRLNAWPAGNTTRKLRDGDESTDLEISIVDKHLGIFRINVLPDLGGDRLRILMGKLKKEPSLNNWVTAGGPFLLDHSTKGYLDDFVFSTLITATLLTPPGNARHYQMNFGAETFTEENAVGPVYDWMHLLEPRRIAWDDDSSKITVDKDGMKVAGGKPLNDEVIKAIAHARAEQVYHEHRDRQLGHARAPKWDDKVCEPRGQVQSVLCVVSPADGGGYRAESEWNLPFPVEPPDLYEILPPKVRAIIFPRLEGK